MSQTMNGREARLGILRGMASALEAAQMTYGPCGWTVAVDYSSHEIRSTKSGSTVLEDFQLSDPCEDAGARLLCHIAQQVQKYAGDGTTLASVLAHAIAVSAHRQHALADNEAEVYRGIRIASQMVEQFIAERSRPVTLPSEMHSVACSASGLDDSLASLIVEAFRSAQYPFAVFLQPSPTSSLEVLKGLLLDAHVHDRLNHPCKSHLLINPLIVIYPGELKTWDQIEHELEAATASGADLLIAAQRICPTFRATMPANIDRPRVHLVSLAMSRLPYPFEELREMFGARLSQSSRRCIIANDKVFLELVVGNFETERAGERAIRAALVSVGEIGDTASRERMERAAQCAASVRAALDQGYVAGGAAILVDAARWLGSQTVDDATAAIGIEILRQALLVPARTLIDSAGECGGQEIDAMLAHPSGGRTFDLRERRACDAGTAGILDATGVVITALRVSASVGALIALTEVLVRQLREGNQVRSPVPQYAHH
ncbi:chaperonin GroEL [Agrobacterium albertimagni AOL15]|uniref:Chaperonin GroEL n=1 Tax=Agrobacterium albertimagni AOL15 TaxID=1156935 RepID=K2QRM6_9HYPH|nr:TCP-1/cpn60 chaperonin family protein [Agrobacterium albertimagni]EKF57687.1 chaperonin GroEL [Agrobacterium albertimagni AOL15]